MYMPKENLQQRVKRFLVAFQAMDDDGDIVVYGGAAVGSNNRREAAIVIELDDEPYGFTTEHARLIADIAQKMISGHSCGDGCGFHGFPTLIRALREGADASEADFNKQRLS
jgi:hypothetical protein